MACLVLMMTLGFVLKIVMDILKYVYLCMCISRFGLDVKESSEKVRRERKRGRGKEKKKILYPTCVLHSMVLLDLSVGDTGLYRTGLSMHSSFSALQSWLPPDLLSEHRSSLNRRLAFKLTGRQRLIRSCEREIYITRPFLYFTGVM